MSADGSPSPRVLTLAGGLAVAGLALGFVLGGVLPNPLRPQPAPAEPPPAAAETPAEPAIPLPPPPLGRAEMIAAAAGAAAAYSVGEPPPAANAGLVGRSFRVALPFGCDGPEPLSAAEFAAYDYSADRATLRIAARPRDWGEVAWIRALSGDTEVDAIEGFWIERPWILGDQCPDRPQPAVAPVTPASETTDAPPAKAAASPQARTPPAKTPPAKATSQPAGKAAAAGPEGATTAGQAAPALPPPSEETLGLARFFDPEGSRLQRRSGRAYEVTRRVAADAPPPPNGYRLVLEGRVVGYPDGSPVKCRAATPDRRPACLFAVEFDRVAVEEPGQAEVLAEWRS